MPEKSGGKARKGANLGRSIMRQQFREQPAAAELETERGKGKLRSVTQCDDLEEFMTNATLEGTDFAARRGEVIVLASEARTVAAVEAPRDASVATDLPVPRRPVWKEGMGAEELDERERAAFVGWRRYLASLEEVDGECLTPFEKNLEVWRQLWRVLERSQLVVQIVDARNPLLFRSIDLERYASELVPPRPCMLLVNKADLLSQAQREEWAAYFQRKGIEAIFWSATAAQAEIDAWARGERPEGGLDSDEEEELGGFDGGEAASAEESDGDGIGEEVALPEGGGAARCDGRRTAGADGVMAAASATDVTSGEESEDDDEDAMLMRLAATVQRAPPRASAAAAVGLTGESSPHGGRAVRARAAGPKPAATARVLGRGALLRLLLARCPPGPALPDGRPARTVGLVGYPNVGKSSTVNAMVAAKKTNVSATPGKTKHFQTLHVPDCPELVLCDCPGLVFPSIAGSKAQMICDGILPIDQMKDYMPPIRLLCGRLSLDELFQAYGVRLRSEADRLDDPDSPEPARELLIAMALSRGFMVATKGGPDESRAARILLKDLVNAKLLHCSKPPDVQGAGAAGPEQGKGRARKEPAAPTAERWLTKLRQDYEAQGGREGHFAGRRGAGTKGAPRGVQFNTPQGTLPDRLVARGTKGIQFAPSE